jgi:hypothetical protein
MDVTSLSATIIAVLAPCLPVLTKVKDAVVEKAVPAVSDGILAQGQALWQKLQPKVEGNEDAKLAAAQVAKDPASKARQGVLGEELEKLLRTDPALVQELQQILESPAGGQTLNVGVVSGEKAIGIVQGNVTIN